MKERMKVDEVLKTFENGDELIYNYRGIRIEFKGKRRVLSTSVLHGGIQEELVGVFNYNCLADEYECTLTESSYEEELKRNARRLHLDGERVTGISTAAWMECVAIQEERFEDLVVTAVVTGGVDKNAVRVGDPASYYERNGQFTLVKEDASITPGTINIMLYINKDLAPGVLCRALVTCTEAKVAAMEELMLGSLYSTGIATGSGTDGTIIVSDCSCSDWLTDAGEHSKLGELIGRSVKHAVKEALYLQTGACPARQHKITERGKRYSITVGSIWEYYEKHREEFLVENKKSFGSLCELERKLLYADTDSNLVVWFSLFLHLVDQYQWGLLEWGEILRESKVISKSMLQLGEESDWIFKVDEEKEILQVMLDRAKAVLLALL